MLTNHRFTLDPSSSLQRVASKLPFTYTGADFYALCSDAMLKAVTRQASLVDAKVAAINSSPEQQCKGGKISTAYYFDHYATKEDVAVMVSEEDFLAAERELIPSVSLGELEHYQKVRAQFENVDDKDKDKDKSDMNGEGAPTRRAGDDALQGKHKLSERPIPERLRSRGKGKEKAVDRKGKGKAVASWDAGDDLSDEGYGAGDTVNGHFGKGKEKAVDMGFHDDEADDGLY